MGKPPWTAEKGSKEKKGLLGVGVGLMRGSSYSSRKPPLQLGQRRSEEVGEGVMETVRLHS